MNIKKLSYVIAGIIALWVISFVFFSNPKMAGATDVVSYPRSDFNLTSMCKPSEDQGSLRIRNNSSAPQPYTLTLSGSSTTYTGTVPVGDSLQTVDWNSSSDTWILQIAGYSFTKAIGNNPLCEPESTPTPTEEVTPTETPSNPGGPGDGRSDGRSDGKSSCPECTQAPSGQVLGTSTAPIKAVLGLSTTSSAGNIYLGAIQLLTALALSAAGFKFFKRNS